MQKIGEMLKLSKEKSKDLGDVVVLKVSESSTKTPFKSADIVELTGDNILKSVSFRMKKATAKKLAMSLLKLIGE